MNSELPQDLRYTTDHEWARVDGDTVVVGITAHAAEQLGDVTAVEVDIEIGDRLTAGEVFGSVDSVKAVSDLYAPISGELLAVNQALEDEPELVNSDPYQAGWMIKVKPDGDARSALSELLDADGYGKLLEDES